MNNDWYLFKGITKNVNSKNFDFPEPPPWRKKKKVKGNKYYITDDKILDAINAGIYLRRPIIVEGTPGIGKSSLAYAIADELGLDLVKWEITNETSLSDGLYSYDAVGRIQSIALKESSEIDNFLFLESLGYAIYDTGKPKVLLIDELDKGSDDLINSLLHIFEEMSFYIPELSRVDKDGSGIEISPSCNKSVRCLIKNGLVNSSSKNFPIIIITSNDDKEFSPAFLRRCLCVKMKKKTKSELLEIIKLYFNIEGIELEIEKIIEKFLFLRDEEDYKLSIDQLLNAINLIHKDIDIIDNINLLETIFNDLDNK